ncbi:MAG TPA: TonB-dependent copper receptor [Mariprofundaceae bacterium]|nr:TonB-dependent copper receptor [Mariprofundaceae bacterium]
MKGQLNAMACLLALGLTVTLAPVAFAADTPAAEQTAGNKADATGTLDEVVITAPLSREPLKVETDPRAPRQPMPAHDGADYLKSIPGFSMIRKGGTDGDPVFRGMAGSRLNILLDGEQILGGCGMRMDPPTAYVFPGAYDRITVLKGPETVLYGPGASAGTVLFERDVKRFRQAGIKADGTLTVGSFGRNDEMLDLRAGTPDGYAQVAGTRSHSNDYKDGGGNTVHSNYTRWSANAALGWTPGDNTLLELSAAKSDGRAAYADRSMDGVKFSRDNVGLKFRQQNISSLLENVEAQAYYNYVDHVMDNYTLRTFTPTAMMPNPAVNNPDRKTTGGKLIGGFALGDATDAHLGVDIQNNIHTSRITMNQLATPYDAMARTEDARFRNYGVFGDVHHDVTDHDRLLAGVRVDNWRAEDKRVSVMTGMTMTANPTYGAIRNETLTSGFGRYEHDLGDLPATLYVGIGYTSRFPDYWEMIMKESLNTVSAFYTKPEKTTQVDAGVNFNGETVIVSLSAFYSRIKDFNLIQSNVVKPAGMMGTRLTTVTRNVNATTWGGEASLAWLFADSWKADATLAYTYGRNDTDNLPLGQMPPLEGRLGLNYDDKVWSAGALWRLVATQSRYAVNQGNIVGQDLGRTGGFGVLSLHAGWKPTRNIQLTAGVDNVLDKLYAEHISRNGSAVPGYITTTRINEMGRSLWLSANISY